jgi:hypothetical protein
MTASANIYSLGLQVQTWFLWYFFVLSTPFSFYSFHSSSHPSISIMIKDRLAELKRVSHLRFVLLVFLILLWFSKSKTRNQILTSRWDVRYTSLLSSGNL